MHTLLFFAVLLPQLALSAPEIQPQEAFFLLVGANDKQMSACPSPVEIKKDSLKTGDFLKSIYPEKKIQVEAPMSNRHRFIVGQRAVELTIIAPTEIHWEERAVTKDFNGKLCKRAIYTTNAMSQEEIDSMIHEEDKIPLSPDTPATKTKPAKTNNSKSKKK